MEDEAKLDLLGRLARGSAKPSAPGKAKGASILTLAAACYASCPEDEATVPTGFDPLAVSLFEAIVEGAYLVATADDEFDPVEQAAFERVVVAACGGMIQPDQIAALVNDLADQLREDGRDARVRELAKRVHRVEHAHEVMRVAALLARVSGDVSEVERSMLSQIGEALALAPSEVLAALAEVDDAVVALTAP